MAFARVQGNGADNGGSAGSISVTISAVGSGNAICGFVAWDNTSSPTLSSVTDDKGNTYNLETTAIDATHGQCMAGFSRTNITNAPTVITATFSISAGARKIIVDEFSGGSTASTDERDGAAHGGQVQQSPGTGTDAITSGTFTTATNGDLLWGGDIEDVGSNNPASSGTSFTSGTQNLGTYAGNTEFRTQATAGSGTAATFTQAVNDPRVTFLIAIKPPSSGSSGAAAGTGTATGVGAATAASVGAAAGTGTAAAVGAATAASVGAAAGTGTAAAVGAATAASVGAAAGTGTATGVGAATAASVGAAAGTGTATGVGAATAASVGAAAGTGTATAVGAATAASVGAAAGAGTATGVGADASASGSIGAASGTGTATGVGASIAAAVGAASGTGDAPGVGASTAASVGAAAGQGDAFGVGRDASTPATSGYAMALGGEDLFYEWWRRQKRAIERTARARKEADRVELSPAVREAIRAVPTAILEKIDKAATTYDVRVIASGLDRLEAGIVEAVARAADEEAARQEEEDVASVFLSLM